MRKSTLGLAAGLLVGSGIAAALLAPATAADPADAAERCAALAGSSLPGEVAITAATHVPAGIPETPPGAPAAGPLPAHCLVEGTINAREGAGGQSYGIGFQLALPDQWNNRFLLMGGGGLNGSIRPPHGPVAAGASPALARGFAVASHDSGHKGAGFDASFEADQRAALDFAETSVRTVTEAAKQLTVDYYQDGIGYSYMTGCSTGGREGMLASQRYPELFDGIVVGAPAMMTGYSNLAIEHAQVMVNRAAPLAADGLPDVAKTFSMADRELIRGGILRQCDGLDGRADGMIENVAACRFRPATLQCRAGQQDDCLSAAQVEGIEAAFAGPRDGSGHPLYFPFPWDTGVTFAGSKGALPGFLPTGQPGVFGPAARDIEIDLDARDWEIRGEAMQRLTDTNVWTNLNSYFGKGSKILFYHGVSDPWFSAKATWDYFERATEANGADWANGARFYMNPGMGHCRGGDAFDQFDLLTPLMDWVEKGEAPETRPIVATRTDGRPGERPLCPHPQYPHYTGGDPLAAGSYSCRAPAG